MSNEKNTPMGTITISVTLPNSLADSVNKRVKEGHYHTRRRTHHWFAVVNYGYGRNT